VPNGIAANFLQSLTTLPLSVMVFLAPPCLPLQVKDYFKELGVKPSSCAGTYTALTASLMQREVVRAIEICVADVRAARRRADAVGARIASLLHEAQIVTPAPLAL